MKSLFFAVTAAIIVAVTALPAFAARTVYTDDNIKMLCSPITDPAKQTRCVENHTKLMGKPVSSHDAAKISKIDAKGDSDSDAKSSK